MPATRAVIGQRAPSSQRLKNLRIFEKIMKRKKEEIVMRNRFHKEPVDPNNIIRPDQAGTKENPDYVVNIQGN